MSKPWTKVSWRKKREELLKTRDKCEWCGSTEKLTIDHNKKPNSESEKDYLDFKDVTVLCHRCAYARLKGMVLCKTCKKKYHKSRYDKCWECSDTHSLKEILEKESEWERELETHLRCKL